MQSASASTADLKHREGPGVQATIQRLGGYLAGMIMPNIAAFIAWGLITALFIPTGWWPNEQLAKLVGPMILNLLPILIGYTGGRLVHGQRGAVVGAVATMGVVVGTDIPMFLGAMIIGPLAAYILKQIDGVVQQRTRAGFEMLVDNFSAGILGLVMAVLGLLAVGPIVETFANAAGDVVNTMVTNNVLPLVSIVVEPAKVLFLNNAINHGVLAPLGVAQALAERQVDPVHDRDEPGPRPWHPARLPVLRSALAATERARGDHHPLLRRHPRDLLPVRADEPAPDPRRHRRRRLRRLHRGRHRRRPRGHALAGQHLRLPGGDAQGRLLRRPARHRGGHGVSFGVASMLLGFGRSEQPVVEAATTRAAPACPTRANPDWSVI